MQKKVKILFKIDNANITITGGILEYTPTT